MEGALTMRKSMIVPVLLLSLLLTACGGEEAGSGRNSFWSELGMDETEIVLVADGREIPAWRYAYWLATACTAMEAACAGSGVEPDWAMPLEEGTLGDYVASQALEDTLLYAAVENRAEKQGVTLTAEPAGESIPCPAGFPLEPWQRQELDAVGLLYRQMLSQATAEDSTLEAFADAQGIFTVSRLSFPAGEDREAARRQAEETFSRINQAVDKTAVFDAFAASESGSVPLTCRVGDGTLPSVEEQAAAALEPEQISGILEGEDGFSILRRLPPDREVLVPLWLEEALMEQVSFSAVERREAVSRLTAATVCAALTAE